MEEKWRLIENTDGIFEVSNTGKIRNTFTKNILKVHCEKGKGVVCSYTINKKSSKFNLKIEVYKAFKEKQYNGKLYLIVHKNGNIYDNSIDNLLLVKRNDTKYFKRKHKKNMYEKENNYIKVFLENSEEYFLIDQEDSWILEQTWYKRDSGYITCSSYNGKSNMYLHRLIMSKYFNIENKMIDHKNRNKLDNRKENLRICTISENNRNSSMCKNNKSGIIGVSKYYETKKGIKWRACIKIKGKTIQLLNSYNFQDCVMARLKAEKEYYGEFAPQRNLFEKYGI